jgi:predicted DNA-binding transcriptional regulator AlpA
MSMNAITLAEVDPNTRLTFAEWVQLIGVGGDLDKVMTVSQWAEEAAISVRTAYELLKAGQGPRVVDLSENRIGIRVCDHRAWLAARTRDNRKRR